MPPAAQGFKNKDAHWPPAVGHLLILIFFESLQNVLNYVPIDAEFYADFKNVYFYSNILKTSRVISFLVAKFDVLRNTENFATKNEITRE